MPAACGNAHCEPLSSHGPATVVRPHPPWVRGGQAGNRQGTVTAQGPRQHDVMQRVGTARVARADLTLDLADVDPEPRLVRFESGDATLDVGGTCGSFAVDVDAATGRVTLQHSAGAGERVVLEGVRTLRLHDVTVAAEAADSSTVQRTESPDGRVHFIGSAWVCGSGAATATTRWPARVATTACRAARVTTPRSAVVCAATTRSCTAR